MPKNEPSRDICGAGVTGSGWEGRSIKRWKPSGGKAGVGAWVGTNESNIAHLPRRVTNRKRRPNSMMVDFEKNKADAAVSEVLSSKAPEFTPADDLELRLLLLKVRSIMVCDEPVTWSSTLACGLRCTLLLRG